MRTARSMFVNRSEILDTVLIYAVLLLSIFSPNSYGQQPHEFNVMQFGAKGDGQSDDTLAIQAAVDQAQKVDGIVHIPKGNYLVGSIELPSGVTVYGDGPSTVMLLRNQPNSRKVQTPGHMFLPKDMQSVASVENVIIRDMSLMGNSSAQNSGQPMPGSGGLHGIAILGGKKWTVQRVIVQDFDGDGIYLGRNLNKADAMAQENLIENCTVTRNLRNGMMISHGDRNVLRNNLFEGNQIGVLCVPRPDRQSNICSNPAAYPKFSRAVYASAELDLEPNRIRIADGVPQWERVTNTIIEGNTFQNGNHLAIQMVKGAAEIANTTIQNNKFIDNRDGQILVYGSNVHDTNIINNQFISNDPSIMSFMIRLKGGSNNRIMNNTFSGAIPAGAGAYLVSFESGDPANAPVHCNEFSGNSINMKGGSADINFSKAAQDNVVFNNNFANNLGRVNVDGGRVLQARGPTCSGNQSSPSN